jgi:hypothetical protein
MHAILTNRARKIHPTHLPGKNPSQPCITATSLTKTAATDNRRGRNRNGRGHFKQAGNFKYADLNQESSLKDTTSQKGNSSNSHYYHSTANCHNYKSSTTTSCTSTLNED